MTLTTALASGTVKDYFVSATLGTPRTANDETNANAPMVRWHKPILQHQEVSPSTYDGVQITDVRGTSTGWSLYAYPTDLVSTKGYDLYGVTITWTGDLGVENDQLDPAGTPKYWFIPAQEPATVTLNATGTNQILYNNVALNIPSGSVGMADTYTAPSPTT